MDRATLQRASTMLQLPYIIMTAPSSLLTTLQPASKLKGLLVPAKAFIPCPRTKIYGEKGH
jgi:hypothetical protein